MGLESRSSLGVLNVNMKCRVAKTRCPQWVYTSGYYVQSNLDLKHLVTSAIASYP